MSAREALFWNIWDAHGERDKNALIDAYRSEVLNEAADVAEKWKPACQDIAEYEVAAELRRMAGGEAP